jgi:hypothetical protein
MSNIALFKNQDLSLFEGFEDDITNVIAGANIVSRKIGIKAGTFRQILNGKEVNVVEDRFMNVVVVKAAPVHKIFYADKYEEGKVIRPTCWSSDSQRPDSTVPEEHRQAERCIDCPQHVKGSGEGESRACKSRQKVAVLLEGEIEKQELYEIDLPGQSVFGDAVNGKMPLQAYGRHLRSHNTPIQSVVTEMRFDTTSSSPKLVFKAVRPLDRPEMEAAIAAARSPEAERAVKLSVAAPKVEEEAKPVTKLESKPKPAPVVQEEVEDEVIEEPKKAAKKAAPEVKPKSDLDELVGEWDD